VSEQSLRVLIVDGAGPAQVRLPAADALGNLEATVCAGLDDATRALVGAAFDAVLLVLPAADLAILPAWPALSRAAAESALLVFCDGEPGLAQAVRLAQLGVQHVAPLPASAPALAVRLAVERKALQLSARKAQGTDLMTGLPDQAQLTEHMTQLFALREREPAPMALLAVRLEGLVAAEARLGREVANALRRKVAVRLRVGLRAGDVVAALGPDMLGVLLSRVQDPQDAQRVADKLLHALRSPFTLSGGDVAVAAAIGAARYPQDGKEAPALLRLAMGLAAAAPAAGRAAASQAANDGA
jgi:diguanylate cyclase (GGDEF)-like protein